MFGTDTLNLALSFTLFAGICLSEWLGYLLGRKAIALRGEQPKTGAVEAAVLALLGLLLAFSFSAGQSRLDNRREILVKEANAIGTAWLRLDLLPADRQPALRDLMRRYIDARIAIVTVLPDLNASLAKNAESIQLQNQIWPKAVEAANASPTPQAAMLLLPALNDMIDVTTTREIAARTYTPLLIVSLIYAVALLSGLVAGYGMSDGRRLNRMHIIILAAVVAITVYVILDLGNPRAGLIRLDSGDRAMEMTRESMR